MVAAIEEFADGRAAFFTADGNDNWWHKLGTDTGRALTVEEALDIAILNWEVSLEPVYTQVLIETPDATYPKWLPVPDQFATVRNHPLLGVQPLAVVGNKYRVIQNSAAFQVLNDIVEEGGAHFETAGSIYDGRQVFMTLRLPEHTAFQGKDDIKLYLLAWNSHDGCSAFTLAVTPVRVVCKNTLDLAIGAAKRKFHIRHTASAKERIEEARTALDLTFKYSNALAEDIDKMLDTVYTEEMFQQLVKQLLPDMPGDAKDFVKNNRAEEQAEMRRLWNAPTQDGIRDTAWGALNTVIEWSDFFGPIRAKDKDTARAIKVITGNAAPLKQRAYDLLKAA